MATKKTSIKALVKSLRARLKNIDLGSEKVAINSLLRSLEANKKITFNKKTANLTLSKGVLPFNKKSPTVTFSMEITNAQLPWNKRQGT